VTGGVQDFQPKDGLRNIVPFVNEKVAKASKADQIPIDGGRCSSVSYPGIDEIIQPPKGKLIPITPIIVLDEKFHQFG
jgi:hypothetical protein